MRTIKPKGTLIPIGGAEDKTGKKEIICRAIEETGKKKPCICIITVATNVPEEVSKDYKTAFRDLHMDNISFIHFDSREEADDKKNLDKIKAADLVWFSGGSQLKLSSLLGGTECLDLIKERYYSEAKFVVAGTSAGAAAMSNTMIISGTSQDALVMGELGVTHGLDFINSLFIDTHATERGRFGRLIQIAACSPAILGVGLGEDTALIIHGAEKAEVVGSGLVIIVDGNFITYTDLAETKSGEPITIEGIRLHVLGPGKKFLIKERMIEK
jgi:cyanophycinase